LLPRLTGRRVAVLGMRDADFAVLAARYPEIEFIHHDPPMGLLHDHAGFAAAVEFIHTAQAPFTFLAVGSPAQELLAYAVAAREGAVGVGLCIGAALEFAAGTARRAPLWMRQCEWLHRLAHNPRRLAGRYLISDPRVLAALAEAALRQKMHLIFRGRAI
jgi:exopolysaccharide biosynthesis WecB/TagA/CpsF family protein